MQALRLRSPIYQALISACLLLLASSIVINLVRNAHSDDTAAAWFLIGFVVLLGAALVRCWFLRLCSEGDQITVHNWLRNYRVDRGSLTGVFIKPYDGWFSKAGAETRLFCVGLRFAGRADLIAWGVVHTRRRGQRAAHALAEHLGVPVTEYLKGEYRPADA